MCKCTPEMRTPFCGKPGCEWPVQHHTEDELIYQKVRAIQYPKISAGINALIELCHTAASRAKWWNKKDTDGKTTDEWDPNPNKGEKLMLMVSEISEAMEGERKGLMDDHIPYRPSVEVELADAVIRIADYCGRFGYDLAGAIKDKIEYNAIRPDHKIESRDASGGKKW